MIAVIGSQGLLGRHVMAHLVRSGYTVVTSSHRPGADVCIDLREPVKPFPFRFRNVSWAVLCSAISGLDQCARDVAGSYRFNVVHTIEFIEQLFHHHVVPIFCSSDLVFAGISGNYAEHDPRNPSTEYGRQKKIVEDYLLGQDRPWIILRLSKLYATTPDDRSPIGDTVRRLQYGERVRCAVDQMITPTYVQDVARIIEWCIRTNRRGCYHVAGPQSMTRYELGLKIAKRLQAEARIERCSIAELNLSEIRPLNNTLDTHKLRSDYDGSLTTLDECLSEILQLPVER
ncbi:MAG: NAD-dependent epimerase/dehydratase family protein [Nitrospirae bacterium]|nr:MAG: NAD-dependent epimerase/dehydratase family protein [Nitrospirota bacterium]